MGGAVIGYARDNSSIYYNPGSLAFVDSNSITITANMYQIEQIKIGAPDVLQPAISSTKIGSIPLMVSGMLGQGKSRLKIGYGVISPINFDFKTSSRIEGIFPVVSDIESPGEESFTGQANVSSRLSEVQGILAIGYKLNKKWGIGLSNFAIGRSQDYSKSAYARFNLNDANQTLSSYSLVRNVDYFHLRYVAKIGISFRIKRFAAGFTIQTPSINVAGSGTISAEMVGNQALFSGKRSNYTGYDLKQNLMPHFKTPLALAIGCNWTRKRTTLGFTAEYHFRQKIYTILSAQSSGFEIPGGLYQILGAEDLLRLRTGSKSVANFGIALDYYIKRNLNFVASFRTNRTYYDHGLDNLKSLKTEMSTWDLYHFRAGFTLKQGHSQLTFGFLYGFGMDNSRPEKGEFSLNTESEILSPTLNVSKARYQSLGFLLGYSFLLFDI
jgi:hypothetical protein